MKNSAPQTIYLKDYKVPEFLVDTVDLSFALEEEHATVHSKLSLQRNPKSESKTAALVLDGEKLELLGVKIDGRELAKSEYQVSDVALSLPKVPEKFVLEVTTKIKPQENLTLEGLYKSSGMFCTQCEAQGFRKITYYLDRPDVMAIFSTTITADKKKYPVLLSNGNKIAAQDLGNGKHSVTWQDPFKKPAYLYALVAGDLGKIEDNFVTYSGRNVKLEIYVNPGNEDRCEHAMNSLKKSMRWDEERFGLEYDLDIFMIVAVDDFNFGAMENKGLNIFNSSYVLAKPSTATDSDYEGIEAVVAHEYFHNWTGNRVTCRDWFQLSLKEGLTVYRDQEFTSDMMSRAVKRIEDVSHLRSHQFLEDAGPMAHPIRPSSYMEINNFYTMTVYEKGAEVIRMIATILGRENFRRGIDKYFSLYDGQAVTTEDFVYAMEQASGVDLAQFRDTWYNQAGTPKVKVRAEFDEKNQSYSLALEQSCPDTPGQTGKKPFHIPLAIGILDSSGKELQNELVHLKKANETFTFANVKTKPIPVFLKNFSAPVRVEYQYSDQDLLFIFNHETDAFARWEAGQQLSLRVLRTLIKAAAEHKELKVSEDYLAVFGALVVDESIDPALREGFLSLPDEGYLAQLQEGTVDVDAIHAAREFLSAAIAAKNEASFLKVYNQYNKTESFHYNAEAVGRRALKNACLRHLVNTKNPAHIKAAYTQFTNANNMTDEISALGALVHVASKEREEALAHFYKKWNSDALVMNKWFMLQATSKVPGGLERVQRLMQDPLFSINNPNKVYSLILSFGRVSQVQFHEKSGAAYRFFADLVMDIDARNPSVAARIVSLFNQWKRFDGGRQALMKAELERIKAKEKLSPNVFEIVSKALS